jgi:hypothetical protein
MLKFHVHFSVNVHSPQNIWYRDTSSPAQVYLDFSNYLFRKYWQEIRFALSVDRIWYLSAKQQIIFRRTCMWMRHTVSEQWGKLGGESASTMVCPHLISTFWWERSVKVSVLPVVILLVAGWVQSWLDCVITKSLSNFRASQFYVLSFPSCSISLNGYHQWHAMWVGFWVLTKICVYKNETAFRTI